MSLLSCSTMFTEIHTEISSTIVVPHSVSFFLACCACASINGSFGESFSKVFASFRYPFSCIFKHAICFYCAALSHLGLSVRMYVCIRICAYAFCLYSCVWPLETFIYWVIYCAAIAIMFCVSEQTLIYTWLYHMFSNISYCFSFRFFYLYSLSFSLCCCFFMYSIFNFDFTDYHLLLLIAYRVENLRWFFSFDDFTRCGIGCCCCCCGYLLLVVVVVKLVRFVFNLLIWLCWVSFCFLFFFLLIFYNNLQYHKRITDSEGTIKNTHI